MNDGFPTRHSLLWLLAAQLAVIVPRLDILPVWTALVWLVVAYWYWRIYRGDWHFPPRMVTWGLALVAIVGIALEYRTALALEPQVALLITAFILKMLELKTARDHWLLLMLSYFIVACGFVFSTAMSTVAVALLQLLVLLMAQQSLFRPRVALRPMLATTGRLFAHSLPLMLVLFVLFPRFGPLWSVPLPGESARTGISDSMSPGDISRLSRSSALAFRVSFSGDMPKQSELYWRGLVLERFDGREWSRDRYDRRPLDRVTPSGEPLRYEVILEHGVHEWLLAIPFAEVEHEGVRQDNRYQWLTRSALVGRVRYEARSYPEMPLDAPLDPYVRLKSLQVPGQVNPRVRELAEPWRELAPPERLAEAERFFRERSFVYTLEPPKLGTHSVDEFVFDSRRGFCEHYASSLTFMLRVAGLPARVVLGYQGGERNAEGNYLLVHQSDAHAWVEAWLDGRGWVRVDPTAWVAPSRIELGADTALAGQPGYLADDLMSLRRFKGLAMIANMRLWMDRLEYQWVRWIINYDGQRQWDVLQALFGQVDNRKLVFIVLGALAVPMIVVGLLTISWPQRRRAPAPVEAYTRCCALLQKHGLQRAPGETPRAFAARARQVSDAYGRWLDRVTDAFYRAYYQPVGETDYQRALADLRRLRREFPG